MLLLTDVFVSLLFDLEPAYFLMATGLAWQTCRKKTKVEVVLLMGWL